MSTPTDLRTSVFPTTDAFGSEFPGPMKPTAPPLQRGIGRICVTKAEPVIEGGAYSAKAVVGESFPVTARVFREGHDALGASVILTSPTGQETSYPMVQLWPEGLDIYEAWVTPNSPGLWSFRIEAWSHPWNTWLHNARIKLGEHIDEELLWGEARQLIETSAKETWGIDRSASLAWKKLLATSFETFSSTSPTDLKAMITDPTFLDRIHRYPVRELVTPTADFPLWVDRRQALFSSWYEMFPRSHGARQDKSGTWTSGNFVHATRRLKEIAALGFDVIYLPPIHPIGSAFRKGRNNSLTVEKSDPGSPWAIGSKDGGHDAIHPDLGTFDDFSHFVGEAKKLGMEVALDFALQASPDHPWVKDHPLWFTTRVDGTIAYAENPPKKYQDIYPINFDQDPPGIYAECLRLIEFWVDKGVTIFRVDNPHTKPLEFWAWLMAQMRERHPEVLFLAEAFTRPEMMHALGKVGFHQSYTYFTWRTEKWELEEYLNQLAGEMAPFYRPNFFVNTPDINPYYLQDGNPAAFAIRAILAATMSPTWGIYSGFELCEHEAIEGREEYLNSEKYEYRPRDFTKKPNLNELITKLNHLRRTHEALQCLRTIRFHDTGNDQIIAYSKTSGDDRILVVVSLNPSEAQEGYLRLNYDHLGLDPLLAITAHDLLTDQEWSWAHDAYINLYPAQPAHILVLQQASESKKKK
ncbi:MAG: alpha-1,4-glucan--maltose-1-phosphate maltosyltransferase [Propionibacteriaceae bacterium]|nr:alpha-1,4-glucan--maltose-1-phosphate maltosyltransferase [Propionibacteriaceae bacterium]